MTLEIENVSHFSIGILNHISEQYSLYLPIQDYKCWTKTLKFFLIIDTHANTFKKVKSTHQAKVDKYLN